ncbi:hypothetical protein MKW92_033962 [Papaver armeniacum]|nr:hypothetical protein MKW92_052461 [Papaver armeniacum]KAI3919670.1 hypothetical protein MKW92_033962 [Papaver armeniacum]
MIKDPTIDHYTCLIDLLGRAGRVDEALSVIEQMPFDPNEIIWSWNDVDLIRKIMKAQGVRKNPGQSFLTVNRLSRTFLAAEG